MEKPLAGIRVVDWTIWQQGPVASTMLADLGAEVIKLEERRRGDPGRGVLALAGLPTAGIRNFYFEANNRHKKSVALDLKQPAARDIVYRLVAKSDVFVQNFRRGVAERLGLDYRTLSAQNPRLIYATASGYGPAGPHSEEPSFDYLAQARSGFMTLAGVPGGEPTYLFGGIADQMGAIMLAYGVLGALFVRERYGIAQQIDVSHLSAMIALAGLNVSCRTILGAELPRTPREAAFNPLWNHYRCADGKWLALGMIQADRHWKEFCRALGVEELIDDPRFIDIPSRGRNARELVAILDRVFAGRTRGEWIERLRRADDLVFGTVNTISDLLDDPQVIANEYLVEYEHPTLGMSRVVGVPVRFEKTPGDPRGRAPELGEHTEQVLTEMLDYSWEEVAGMREAGVI